MSTTKMDKTGAYSDAMRNLPIPIIRTKLYPPPIAPDIVKRPRLLSLAQSAARLEDVLPADVSSPSNRAIRDEQQLQLAAALERLPDDYRVVIILRHIEDLPYSEIAGRMKRSEGAVRMLWVRALAQLPPS